MKRTAKNLIIKYLKNKGYIHGGEIEKICVSNDWRYQPTTIKRQCRKMREKGWLDKRENRKGHVTYKLIPENLPAELKQKFGFKMSSRDVRKLV